MSRASLCCRQHADMVLPGVCALQLGGSFVAYKFLDSKHHLSNDIKWMRRLLPVKRSLANHYKKGGLHAWLACWAPPCSPLLCSGWNFAMQWNETMTKYPNKDCVVFDDVSYTFREMEAASNRIANWAASVGALVVAPSVFEVCAPLTVLTFAGLRRGDKVALVMENRPEFIMCMIGFAKAGVVLAMINNNLRSRSLLHCIKVSGAKFALFGYECADALAGVSDDLTALGCKQVVWGGTVDVAPSIDMQLSAASTEPVHPAMYSDIGLGDDFGYIYTSGTTGLPKAAIIKHGKVVPLPLAFWCVLSA